MSGDLLTILVPVLLESQSDVRAVMKTVSEAPADPDVSVLVVIQPGSGFKDEPAAIEAELLRRCPTSLKTVLLKEAAGKWGALRQGIGSCSQSTWVAVVDGDAAYDLSALPDAVKCASAGWDLLVGERRELLIDPTELGRARSHLEPIVNELLRVRLAARGVILPARVRDMQSGFLLVRASLLRSFLARDRMDGVEDAGASGLPRLPWSSYGGELHLVVYAVEAGRRIEPYPVFVRYGRSSGLTVEALGEMLRASCLFQDVTIPEIEAHILNVGAAQGWSPEEADLARWASGAAFKLSS